MTKSNVYHLWDFMPGVDDEIECGTCGLNFEAYVTRSLFRFYSAVACPLCGSAHEVDIDDYTALLDEAESILIPKH